MIGPQRRAERGGVADIEHVDGGADNIGAVMGTVILIDGRPAALAAAKRQVNRVSLFD